MTDFLGTAEQAIRLIDDLIKRHEAYKENKILATEMLAAYTNLHTDISLLKEKPMQRMSLQHTQLLQNKLERLSGFITTSLNELQQELANRKGIIRAHASAIGYREVLEKRKQEAERLHDSVVNQSWKIETHASTAQATDNVLKPSISAEHNPASIYVRLDSRGSDGLPNTCQSRLKAAVLSSGGNAHVPATAFGQGGVGKTCALRAIAHDDDIKHRFSGGVYFMCLGKHANVGRVIEQLCLIVEASGGNRTAAEMRDQSVFSRVLAKVQAWYSGHVCLFIIDDVWVVNDIDASILQQLSILANTAGGSGDRKSKLLYSTRDPVLRHVGETVLFEPREREGKDAFHMLVHTSGATWEEANDPKCKEAVSEILKLCAGLPLALNVAGTSVRYMREQWEGEVSEAWEAYLSKMKSRNTIRGESPEDGYSSLDGMLQASLDILESDVRNDGVSSCQVSFRKIHRSLCVMKKQDRMPLSLLNGLWEMDDDSTEWCAKQMNKVGLVDFQFKKNWAGLRMHDLTHDFALEEAKKEEGVVVWCRKLADVWSQGGSLLRITDSRDGEGKDARDEYVFKNIYRVLKDGVCLKELESLFLNARWVKTVIQRRGVWQYEEAVKSLSRYLRQKRRGGSAGGGTVDEDSIDGMVLMMRAARLSVPFCGESSAGIYFQLYARVKHKASESRSVRKILEEIERYAPRPWLRPVSECLGRAGGSLVEQIILPYDTYRVQVAMDSKGGIYGCQLNSSGAELTVFEQSPDKEMKMIRLESGVQTGNRESVVIGSSMRKGCRSLKTCFGLCVRSETPRVTTEGPQAMIARCAFVCESKDCVVVAYGNGTLRLWSVSKKKVLRLFCGHEAVVVSVVVSADGRRVVSGSYDKSVRIWDAETGAQLGHALTGHTDWVRSVAISANGSRVVSGSFDKSVRVWDVVTGAQVGDALIGHTSGVRSVAISADGKRVVSGSDDKSVRVWDTKTGAQLGNALTGHSARVQTVAICADGVHVVSGSDDKSIRVWDVETGAQVGDALTGHTECVRSVAISAEGNSVVSGSVDKSVRVWGVDTGAQVGDTLSEHTSVVLSVAISANGKRVVSGSDDKSVRVWDVETGAQLGDALTGHRSRVQAVAICADGSRVASGSDDKSVRVWDVEKGAQVGDALTGHTELVQSVAISADGSRVVSGSDDKSVRVWDVKTGALVCDSLTGHTSLVLSVAMSADGKRVVSGSWDKSVRVWDVERGAQIGDALTGHMDGVLSVVMSADGRRVVSGSRNKSVRVWDVEGGITLHIGEEENWQSILDHFLRTEDLDAVSTQAFKVVAIEGKIVHRREDESDVVLAQLEGALSWLDFQVDPKHGVVAAKSGNLVVIMKLVV